MAQQILVVEDQADIQEVVVAYLEREGFKCDTYSEGLTASRSIAEKHYDAAVLDWMLPGLDGLSLCRQIKAKSPDLPVIILSAQGKDQERMEGLQAGADDYLPKPFHPRELVARIRALLRRSQPAAGKGHRKTFGDLAIDTETRKATFREQPVAFSATEMSLLLALSGRPEATLNRQQLLDLAWGNDFPGSERTVDSHIRSLRAKLEALAPGNCWIESVWGVGYRFNPAGMA